MPTLTTFQIPDISRHIKYIYTSQITSEMTLIFVFKTMFRSDDVLVDIYKDDIANADKIISSVKLTSDALICYPRYDLGLNMRIYCRDQDRIGTSVKKYNANKFYIQIQIED